MPTSGFSHSFPVTSSPAPTSAFTGAALLAPGPGACAWVETASRWSYFFFIIIIILFFCTFSWGKGWEKLTGPGKERICEGGCSAQPRFCRVTPVVELAGETEARGSPAEPGAGTVPADGTVCSSCPLPCGCQRGGGTIRSHPHQLGAAAGRARAQLLLIQGLEVGGKPPPPCLQP